MSCVDHRAGQGGTAFGEACRRGLEGLVAKRARKAKAFIDYLRNGRGATAIDAYSPRARPGAPVSTPIAWDELDSKLKSDHFTVLNIPERLKDRRHDPWKGYERAAGAVTNEMTARLSRR